VSPTGNVRFGFSTTEAAVSVAIRTATHSKVSHAFLTFPDPALGIDVVLEAVWDGLVIHPLADVQAKTEVVELITPTVPLDDGLKWLAQNYLGHPYDYLGLACFPWVLACRALGRHPSNPLQRAGSVFCSESVVLAMQHADCGGGPKYPGADAFDAPCVSPQDLYSFVRNQGGRRLCLYRNP
jgi:hypothetical protein